MTLSGHLEPRVVPWLRNGHNDKSFYLPGGGTQQLTLGASKSSVFGLSTTQLWRLQPFDLVRDQLPLSNQQALFCPACQANRFLLFCTRMSPCFHFLR